MNVRRIAVGSLELSLTLAPSLAGAQTRSDGWTVPRTQQGVRHSSMWSHERT